MSKLFSRRSLISSAASVAAVAGMLPIAGHAANLTPPASPETAGISRAPAAEPGILGFRFYYVAGMKKLDGTDLTKFLGDDEIRDVATSLGLAIEQATTMNIPISTDEDSFPAFNDIWSYETQSSTFSSSPVGYAAVQKAASSQLYAGIKDGWKIGINKIAKHENRIILTGVSIEISDSEDIRRYLTGRSNDYADRIRSLRSGGDFTIPEHGRVAFLLPSVQDTNGEYKQSNIFVIEHI